MDTTLTPGSLRARSTADSRSSGLLLFASTSTMAALGARACAHSTSRAISVAQPPSLGLGGGASGGAFAPWYTFRKLGGFGRRKAASNRAKSLVENRALV